MESILIGAILNDFFNYLLLICNKCHLEWGKSWSNCCVILKQPLRPAILTLANKRSESLDKN